MNAVPEFYRTFEAELVALCAPTLAGMKSGSIFSVRHFEPEQIEEKVSKWNERLSVFGLCLKILKAGTEKTPTIIYLFRPSMVERELKAQGADEFLQACGYSGTTLQEHIDQLCERLQNSPDFPHEIGLFIGYPLEDVIGFITHKGRNFCCCGLWKAYGNAEERSRYFQKCQKCQRVYIGLYEQGWPMERLAVAC